ncbi:Fic family protein [Candidatus Pacearchaeota archaeon]|nr:Fic family protein [Candidatus Pacearchaeota archaeon]
MIMSQELADEIQLKREKIAREPNGLLRKSQRAKSNLRKICDIYSVWLEHPDMRQRILTEHLADNVKDIRAHVRRSVTNVKRAWKYLGGLQNGSSFLSVLTPKVILEVGARVNPDTNEAFRDVRVSLGLQNYTPPNPLKVPELVDKVCEEIRKSEDWYVEKAIKTHLRLAGIQPFREGNKRTARLLQDRILYNFDLPPAVIPCGERSAYIDLLEQALVGYRDRDEKSQRPFYDYIGGKVNSALDDILGDLSLAR